VSGKVRVWDCVGEGATKGEYHIISGRINDIAWDGDSQRIIAVGDGRERFGHCITADSGNSVGEIIGHTSIVNAVAIRQQRPLRAATVGDDKSLVFYHGAPFKFNTLSKGLHTNYIYGTAFSPDGSLLVSVGGDKRVWLYDGKTGESKGQLGGEEHTGSIFGVSWSKDSKKFVTASADRTVKIWDVEAAKPVQSWKFGGDDKVISVPHQQVGVVWPAGRTDGLLISLSLEGDLNYLVEGTEKPTKTIQGHQKSITAAGIHSGKDATMWTGSYDGRVIKWDISKGLGEKVHGEPHTNQVVGFSLTDTQVQSAAWDDTIRTIDISTNTFLGTSTKSHAQPQDIANAGKRSVIATNEGIEILLDGELTTIKTEFRPISIASYGSTVAVGSDGSALYVYRLEGKSLQKIQTISTASSTLSTLSFSASGKLLAAGDSSGKINVYNTSDWSLVTNRWSAHTARVTSIAWHESEKYAASGSLDTNVFVWNLQDPGKRIKVSNAHKEGVGSVVWSNEQQLISVGADAAVKGWEVKLE
jgi:WD40 repeat protein